MGFVTARTAGAVCLVLAAGTVAACGGSGDAGGGAARDRADAPGPRPTATLWHSPVRMLSQQELEKAVIGTADLPGWEFSGTPTVGRDGKTVPARIVDITRLPPVSPAACAPLSRMTDGLAANYQHHAALEEGLNHPGTGDSERSALMVLTSYAPADAPKVISDLRASLKTCTSFPFDDGIRITDPEPVAARSKGDDTVAYTLNQVVESIDDHGDPDGGAPVNAPIQFEIVRVGSTIAAFWALGFPGEHPQVPPEVVAAQVAKLGKAE